MPDLSVLKGLGVNGLGKNMALSPSDPEQKLEEAELIQFTVCISSLLVEDLCQQSSTGTSPRSWHCSDCGAGEGEMLMFWGFIRLEWES